MSNKLKLMLISMVPPRNDCGVRIVMHRHLVELSPFELHVASHADFADDLLIHTQLKLPTILHRLRKSRFGHHLSKWIHDWENHIWPNQTAKSLQKAIDEFRPNVILTLAETGLCHMAARAAEQNGIPLAVLFLDWFPIMPPHYGHKCFQKILSRRYRALYNQCDLAICTSDGMKETLGAHPNSHVIYPMPGSHNIPSGFEVDRSEKFRLVYVGSALGFYGRMLRQLLDEIRAHPNLELIIVGPNADWPKNDLSRAQKEGSCLGFMPPEDAAKILASANALLVVMSFEKDQELFMRTSFTTKFLDYAAFHKPIILWGPDYCTPMRVAKRENAAVTVDQPDASQVLLAAAQLAEKPDDVAHYSTASRRLHEGLFNPDRLQEILVSQIKNIARA